MGKKEQKRIYDELWEQHSKPYPAEPPITSEWCDGCRCVHGPDEGCQAEIFSQRAEDLLTKLDKKF